MFKIFGIPNCNTVKKARDFVAEKNIEVEFIDFKKTTPTPVQLKRWAEAFGGIPVNAKGITYKKHKDVFEKLSLSQKITFLQENTSMIKRPILEKNDEVLAFGFDEQSYESIFK